MSKQANRWTTPLLGILAPLICIVAIALHVISAAPSNRVSNNGGVQHSMSNSEIEDLLTNVANQGLDAYKEGITGKDLIPNELRRYLGNNFELEILSVRPSPDYWAAMEFLSRRDRLSFPMYVGHLDGDDYAIYTKKSRFTIETFIWDIMDFSIESISVMEDIRKFFNDMIQASQLFNFRLERLLYCTNIEIEINDSDDNASLPRIGRVRLSPQCAFGDTEMSDTLRYFLIDVLNQMDGSPTIHTLEMEREARLLRGDLKSLKKSFVYNLIMDIDMPDTIGDTFNDLNILYAAQVDKMSEISVDEDGMQNIVEVIASASIVENIKEYPDTDDEEKHKEDVGTIIPSDDTAATENAGQEYLIIVESIRELNELGIYHYKDIAFDLIAPTALLIDHTECEHGEEKRLEPFITSEDPYIATVRAIYKHAGICTVFYDYQAPPLMMFKGQAVNARTTDLEDPHLIKSRAEAAYFSILFLKETNTFISLFSGSVRNTPTHGFVFIPRIDDIEEFTIEKEKQAIRELGLIYVLGRIYATSFFENVDSHPCTLFWYSDFVKNSVADAIDHPALMPLLDAVDDNERNFIIDTLSRSSHLDLDDLLDYDLWDSFSLTKLDLPMYLDGIYRSAGNMKNPICSVNLGHVESSFEELNKVTMPIYDYTYLKMMLSFLRSTTSQFRPFAASFYQLGGVMYMEVAFEPRAYGMFLDSTEFFFKHSVLHLPFGGKDLSGVFILTNFIPLWENPKFTVAITTAICISYVKYFRSSLDQKCREAMSSFCDKDAPDIYNVGWAVEPDDGGEPYATTPDFHAVENCAAKAPFMPLMGELANSRNFLPVSAYFNSHPIERKKTLQDSLILRTLFKRVFRSPNHRKHRLSVETNKSVLRNSIMN